MVSPELPTTMFESIQTGSSTGPVVAGLIPLISTIIGGCITLAGVLITLRWNERSNHGKLTEERRKTKEDREFASKQAVFMGASKAIVRYIHCFLSLADRPLPVNGAMQKEVAELGIALSRLHFYCGLETIEKTVQLNRVLDNAVMEALKARMPSAFSTEELKGIEVRLSGLETTEARIQQEILALLHCDPQNPLIVSHRNRSAEIFTEMASLCEKKCDIVRRQFIETEKCRDIIQRNTRAIYGALRDVLLLARQELSFPIDETRYKDVMDRYVDDTERQLADFFSEVRRQCLWKMDSCMEDSEQEQ